MLKGSRYNQTFLANQCTGRDPCRNILWRDHFAHHSTSGVHSSHQYRAELELFRRYHLQVPEITHR